VIVGWCENVLLRVEVDGTSQVHGIIFTNFGNSHGHRGTLEVLSESTSGYIVDGILDFRLTCCEYVIRDLDVDGVGTLFFTFVHNFA